MFARPVIVGLAALIAFAFAFGVLSEMPPDDPAAELAVPQPSPRLQRQQDPGTEARIAGNPTGPRTIPHRIDGHQLTNNYNRCLACHGREAPEAVRATPIPATHLIDRDGEAREPLAGGRYACTTCHVPQHVTIER